MRSDALTGIVALNKEYRFVPVWPRSTLLPYGVGYVHLGRPVPIWSTEVIAALGDCGLKPKDYASHAMVPPECAPRDGGCRPRPAVNRGQGRRADPGRVSSDALYLTLRVGSINLRFTMTSHWNVWRRGRERDKSLEPPFFVLRLFVPRREAACPKTR